MAYGKKNWSLIQRHIVGRTDVKYPSLTFTFFPLDINFPLLWCGAAVLFVARVRVLWLRGCYCFCSHYSTFALLMDGDGGWCGCQMSRAMGECVRPECVPQEVECCGG